MPAKEHLALYSARCKTCGHLDPDEPKKYSKCHFSAGNKECPASEVQIVVVGKAKRWATLVAKARKQRNPGEETKILSAVSGQSSAFQSRFYDELSSLERDLCVTPTHQRSK